jgi:AcrR family transcriptional regulator
MEAFMHRKESVVLTAIEILDELGIQGLSSKEIAKRQHISEGTLFKHFKSKNDIILAVLDYFSQFDFDIMESIRIRQMGYVEGITYFITVYAEYYENYPAITALVNGYEILRWDKELCERYKSILHKRSDFIRMLVESGKTSGEIYSSASTIVLTDIITGVCMEIALKWRISGYRFSLKQRMLEAVKSVIEAFSEKAAK